MRGPLWSEDLDAMAFPLETVPELELEELVTESKSELEQELEWQRVTVVR